MLIYFLTQDDVCTLYSILEFCTVDLLDHGTQMSSAICRNSLMDKYWFPMFWKSAKRTFVHIDTSSESEIKNILYSFPWRYGSHLIRFLFIIHIKLKINFIMLSVSVTTVPINYLHLCKLCICMEAFLICHESYQWIFVLNTRASINNHVH